MAALAADRAERNLEPFDPVARALWAEQRMRRRNFRMRGKAARHQLRRAELHRSDIQNQRSRPDMGRNRIDRLGKTSDGRCKYDAIAACRLAKAGEPNAVARRN